MTKQEMERFIFDKMNEAGRLYEYGGYISVELAKDIISEALYGKTMRGGTKYHRDSGERHGFVYVSYNITSEECAKITKTLHRMLDKGAIVVSKSHKMVKPTMTADEWFKKSEAGC